MYNSAADYIISFENTGLIGEQFWLAKFEDRQDDVVGYGATLEMAMADLFEQYEIVGK